MKSHRIFCLAASAALAGTAVAMAAPLTIDDYCDVKTAAPHSVKEMKPLADGQTYSCISDDEKSIDVYSYRTGKKVSTLFSVDNIAGSLKISEFDGYELSANEKKILLWNESEQIYRHTFRAEYYVYDVARRTLTRVSEAGAQQGAILSHDGRMVAYQRGNNIYIANLDYGTDVAVTTDGEINHIINGTPDWGYEEEFGVINTMRWSPDDRRLAFIRFDESEVPAYSFDNYRSYCQEDPLGDLYPEAYTYKYPLAGYPNSVVSVLSYDIDSRITKKMDLPIGETDYVPSMEFDGKGDNLMVMVLNRDQNHLDLYKVNPGSTVSQLILTQTSKAWLAPDSYQMVDYGENDFVIGSDESGYRHLYQYNYNGVLQRQITNGDFNVTNYYGRDSRKGVHYVQTTSLGAINRTVASVDGKGNVKLLHGEEGTENAWFSRDFSYYLRSYSSATTPTQYAIYTIGGKQVQLVESNADYAAKYASAPKMEFLKVKNADGQEMNAYIIKPADFDPNRKYPLMMYQYNGPDSQEVLNRWRMEGIFYVASQGYIVAAVDGRGTGNRNRAWAHAVYCRLGQDETADQLAGAAYFASLPYVDAERTSCFGWSYGGYMTLMELSDPSCRFKCGVSMAPVTDWRLYDSIYTERYMRTPQQNKAGYDAASALERTQQMKSRLLIMSGTSDDNVHYYNTLKYASKLNYEGTVFDMMSYAGFEHSLRMCNARARLFDKLVDFLDSNLK
ncbi:MAG: DPP IV N-terminal domain-containing protein [Muribaculaceae bacterium]|nr:DPP IV N-terminal domain-containing protein [Muribaculaceae bacterium]